MFADLFYNNYFYIVIIIVTAQCSIIIAPVLYMCGIAVGML